MDDLLLVEHLLRASAAVVAVKDAGGSEEQAKEALGLTQGGVSLRIKAAEERYGELFEFASKRRDLTRMGQALYDFGKTLERVKQEIASREPIDAKAEVLRVGYSRSHLALVATALANVIKPKGGGPKIITTETSPKKVRQLLHGDKIDVGVTYAPHDPKPDWLGETRLGHLPLALVVSRTHRFAVELENKQRSDVTAEDLRNEPLALLERDATDIRDEINRYFKHEKPKNVVLEADAATTLLAVARQGIATILPAFPQDNVFAVIRLPKTPVRTIALLWNKQVPRKNASREFEDALKYAALETLEDDADQQLRDGMNEDLPSP